MNSLMEFNEYVKRGIVKKQRVDKSRSDDLIREAERKHNSLLRVLEKIGLDEENANDVIEDCYDIIANLIRAKMFLGGYNASGNGAHEAEVSYMRILGFSENDLKFTNQLRYFRNGILYYGKSFDSEYAEKVVLFMKRVRGKLK